MSKSQVSGIKKHYLGSSLFVSAVLISLLPGTTVHAAEDDQDGTSAFDEIIVVTARKREESLQETPISITAFSSHALEARGIQNTEGLAQLTPNLTLQNNPSFSGASNSASIYIRGVGQQDLGLTVQLCSGAGEKIPH